MVAQVKKRTTEIATIHFPWTSFPMTLSTENPGQSFFSIYNYCPSSLTTDIFPAHMICFIGMPWSLSMSEENILLKKNKAELFNC